MSVSISSENYTGAPPSVDPYLMTIGTDLSSTVSTGRGAEVGSSIDTLPSPRKASEYTDMKFGSTGNNRTEKEDVVSSSAAAVLLSRNGSTTESSVMDNAGQATQVVETANTESSSQSHLPKLDDYSQRIIRTHYMDQILTDLKAIQPYSKTSEAARFANRLLRTMREMNDRTPNDPYGEIVMALHDALAFENHWLDYSDSQYEAAYGVLDKRLSITLLTDNVVEKSIMELEEIGFDTFPFEVDFDVADGEAKE